MQAAELFWSSMSATRDNMQVKFILPVVFHKPNPKRKGTGSHARYSKYFVAKTLNGAEKLGMTSADFNLDPEPKSPDDALHENNLEAPDPNGGKP